MPSKRKRNQRRMRRVQAQRRLLEEQHAANPLVKASPGIVVGAPPVATSKKATKVPAPSPEKTVANMMPKVESKPAVMEAVVELILVKAESPVSQAVVLEKTIAEVVQVEVPAPITEEKPVITEEAPPPVTEEPVITKEAPAPVIEEPVITKEAPAPVIEEPVITEEAPPPVIEEPVITEEAPAPVTEEPVITEEAPAPVTEKPVITEEAPAPVTEEPVITEEAPAPVTEKPVITEEAPAPVTEEPVITKEAPAPVTEKPVITEEAPAPVTEKPVITEEAPAPVTEEPVITEEAPAPVTEEPVITEEDPAVRTAEEPPVVVQEAEPVIPESVTEVQSADAAVITAEPKQTHDVSEVEVLAEEDAATKVKEAIREDEPVTEAREEPMVEVHTCVQETAEAEPAAESVVEKEERTEKEEKKMEILEPEQQTEAVISLEEEDEAEVLNGESVPEVQAETVAVTEEASVQAVEIPVVSTIVPEGPVKTSDTPVNEVLHENTEAPAIPKAAVTMADDFVVKERKKAVLQEMLMEKDLNGQVVPEISTEG